MEELLKLSNEPLSKTILSQKKVAKRIGDRVLCRTQVKKMPMITKRHVDRYLYTFALEIGCDLPNDQLLKSIYFLLLDSEENVSLNEGVQQANFHILVNVCLNIYEEAKKTAIGGIFQRIMMGLKQALYYVKLESICQSGKPE